jgi:hypothetical protein
MPLVYTNAEGAQVQSQTQHLDDYALEVWTEQVILPTFDEVCTPALRQHYPHSWAQIKAKANVHSETQVRDNPNSKVDIRTIVRPDLLGSLWDGIVARAAQITNTLLPADAFSGPGLIISNHNLKQSGISRHDFPTTRDTYLEEHNSLWNSAFITNTEFFIDLGQEIWSIIPGTTLLRKSCCNKDWAAQFWDTSGSNKTLETYYTWAGTEAGSVTIETRAQNSMRATGIAYNKAYNVIKEQFSTAAKDDTVFGNELFELLSFTDKQLGRLTVGQKKGGIKLSITREQIIRQWEAAKKRIWNSMNSARNNSMSYGSRQEFRITYDLFLQLPAELFSQPTTLPDQPNISTTHRPFWILPTIDVNRFRIAECNRWILCMEHIIQAAEPQRGSGRTISVSAQDLYSGMTVALARTLRLSLGCQNPDQHTSLWLGKRWGRRRIPTGSNRSRVKTVYYKRRGLEYKSSVQQHGMIWMPHRLGTWSTELPVFRISKYRHLDILVRMLSTTRLGRDLSQLKTREGKFLDHLYREISIIAEDTSQSFYSEPWCAIFVTLSQYCIQAYNLYIWGIIRERWCKHAGIIRDKKNAFEKAARLSNEAREGTEILCFSNIKRYIGRNLGIRHILCAHAPCQSRVSKEEWQSKFWGDRVKPIFNPGEGQPTWIKNAEHTRRLLEIEAMLESIVPAEVAAQCCRRFRTTLWKTARLDVQAILHYSKTKSGVLAYASRANSVRKQQERKNMSDLQRTRWMFPKLATQDRPLFDQPEPPNTSDTGKTEVEMKALGARLRVFTKKDVQSYNPAKDPRMLHDGSAIGRWPSTLVQLEGLQQDFEQMLDEGRDEDGEESEESDWPSQPACNRTIDLSDEAEFTDSD